MILNTAVGAMGGTTTAVVAGGIALARPSSRRRIMDFIYGDTSADNGADPEPVDQSDQPEAT